MKTEAWSIHRERHNRAYRKPKSAKIVRQPDDTCEGKHRHPNQVTALAAAMSHLARHVVEQRPERLFAYPCITCRGWHLSKNPWLNDGAPYATANAVVYP